jgi:putative SOS response-associated peptidase YedK
MCGRYYVALDELELRSIVEAVERSVRGIYRQLSIKTEGEVFPSDIVPVQVGEGQYQPMKWGFAGHDKRLIINARSETAAAKPLFKEAMAERRCLIPASGYFEWQKVNTPGKAKKAKTKYAFTLPNGSMYLAGCYRQEKDTPVPSFVILTRDASDGIKHIHDRMPIIFSLANGLIWLRGEGAAGAVGSLDAAGALGIAETNVLYREAEAGASAQLQMDI